MTDLTSAPPCAPSPPCPSRRRLAGACRASRTPRRVLAEVRQQPAADASAERARAGGGRPHRQGRARAASRSRSSRTTSSAATPTCWPGALAAASTSSRRRRWSSRRWCRSPRSTRVGFAFADYEQVWEAMDGELGAHVRAAHREGRACYAFEKMWDNGFRQITTSSKPIETRQGHGRPEDPRAGEPAVDRRCSRRCRRCAGQPAVQRGLLGAADQDRRRAGEPAADHPGRQALRGAEVLLADQPHLGRLLVHRQRPRLGAPAGRPEDDRRQRHQRRRR